MSALDNSQDLCTVVEEERHTHNPDNSKISKLRYAPKCLHWTAYGYVKADNTDSSAYRPWVEGFEMNEGAVRDPEKGGHLQCLSLCWETEAFAVLIL